MIRYSLFGVRYSKRVTGLSWCDAFLHLADGIIKIQYKDVGITRLYTHFSYVGYA